MVYARTDQGRTARAEGHGTTTAAAGRRLSRNAGAASERLTFVRQRPARFAASRTTTQSRAVSERAGHRGPDRRTTPRPHASRGGQTGRRVTPRRSRGALADDRGRSEPGRELERNQLHVAATGRRTNARAAGFGIGARRTTG